MDSGLGISKKKVTRVFPFIIIGIFAQIIDNDFILFADYICFYIHIAYYYREVFIKYILLVIQFFWNILSVFVIENFLIPVSNMAVMSSHTGAFKLLFWVNIVYFACIIHFDSKWEKRLRKPARMKIRNKKIFKLIYLFIIIFIILMVLDIFRNNYYFSGSADRYSYALNTKNISLRLYGWFIYLIPVASMYSIMKKNRGPIIIVSVLYFCYLFLIGDKFGGYLQEAYLIAISYILPEQVINGTKFNIKKILILLSTAVGALLLFSLYHYYIKNGTIEAAALELFNRIFNGQGDVWWGIFRHCKDTGFHLNEIGDEVSALSVTTDDQYTYNFGIYKLMKIISPASIVQHYALHHVRFAMSTDASIYYYFGAMGVILWRAISAFVIVKITNGLIRSCINLLPASAFLYSWILVAYLGVAIQSNFAIIFTRTNIMSIMILFFLYMEHYGYRYNYSLYKKLLKKGK